MRRGTSSHVRSTPSKWPMAFTPSMYVRMMRLETSTRAASPFTADTVAPTAEVTPAGENATIEEIIVVHFSEMMDGGSIVILVNNVQMALSLSGDNATLTSFEIEYNNEYEVTVSGSDLTGNEMHLVHTFSAMSVGGIDGLLVYEQGTFMSGVTVYLGDAITMETTENGEFLFSNIPIGDYTLAVELEGYETLMAEVTVVVGHTHVGVLTMYYQGVSVISVLINEDGQAMGGVTVELSGVGTEVTDEWGHFLFLYVGEGEYTLTAQLDGHETITESVTVGADNDVDLGIMTMVATDDGGNGGDDDDVGTSSTLLIIVGIVAAVVVTGVVGYVVYIKKK